MRLRLSSLALLSVAALAIACGGSGEEPVPTATAETTTADSLANSPGSIRIPSIGVDAPLSLKHFVVGEPLPSPDGTSDVATYDFGTEADALGGFPGEGGNVVLTGRNLAIVGCAPAEPPCNAVFRGLNRIAPGSPIEVEWQGGLLEYQVVAKCSVPTLQFSDDLYQRTVEEQLTLMTGVGSWNNEVGWSHVLVIIAKPAPRTAVEACPQGTPSVRT